jgi:excisionase family DNA binding protein
MNTISSSDMHSTSLLNAEEVAQRLRISVPMAYRLIQRGDIPAIRIGRLVRVRDLDLEAFITNQIIGRAG